MWAEKQSYVYTLNKQPVVGSQESAIPHLTHCVHRLDRDYSFGFRKWDMVDHQTEKDRIRMTPSPRFEMRSPAEARWTFGTFTVPELTWCCSPPSLPQWQNVSLSVCSLGEFAYLYSTYLYLPLPLSHTQNFRRWRSGKHWKFRKWWGKYVAYQKALPCFVAQTKLRAHHCL